MARGHYIEVIEYDNFTHVRITHAMFTNEETVAGWREEVFALVERRDRPQILLDFERVEYLGSPVLGPLVTLAKKVKQAGGRLALCGIRPDIFEVFEITRLDIVFGLASSTRAGLDAAQAGELFRQRVVYRCPLPVCGTEFRSPHPLSLLTAPSYQTCPACTAQLQFSPSTFPAGEADVPLVSLELETYPKERAGLRFLPNPATLTITGRLDLFALDVVGWLWDALPGPRAVVADLSATTEVSRRGAEGLLHLAQRTDDRLVLFANRPIEPLGPILTTKEAVREALASIPESQRALPVRLRVEE